MPSIPHLPQRAWTTPTPIDNAYSDDSPALAGDGTRLFLAFKKAGSTDIYYSMYSNGTWSTPAYTYIQSEKGPALTWNPSTGTLYMYWQAVGSDSLSLDFGTIDLQSGYGTRKGQVASAYTGNSPASTWFDGGTWLVHTGKTSDDIYYCEPDGTGWDEDNIKGKSSNRAPALAATSSDLYMVHGGGGATDQNDLYWSSLTTTADPHSGWTDDQELDNGGTSGRPGLGAWQDQYLILAHNSSGFINLLHPETSLQWHYYDVANGAWHWQGYCGRKFQTSYGPALFYLPAPAGGGGGGIGGIGGSSIPYGMYMVWPNAADTSNQLVWSVLESVT